jgi:hypothetical protein
MVNFTQIFILKNLNDIKSNYNALHAQLVCLMKQLFMAAKITYL